MTYESTLQCRSAKKHIDLNIRPLVDGGVPYCTIRENELQLLRQHNTLPCYRDWDTECTY